jgi:hypothetical protein
VDSLVQPVGIDMVWVHGELVLYHGTLIAPFSVFGRILTNPNRARPSG